jgi:hypothetical protein
MLLASAASESAPLIWDVTGRILGEKLIKALASNELEKCWADLAESDAATAWKAILALEARPEQAGQLFKQRLSPNPKLDAKGLAQLRADLNHDNFQVREQAAKQFEVLGKAAGPSLRKILASEPPVEVRKRVARLLDKIAKAKGAPLSEELRALRAQEILEDIATPHQGITKNAGRGRAGSAAHPASQGRPGSSSARHGDQVISSIPLRCQIPENRLDRLSSAF